MCLATPDSCRCGNMKRLGVIEQNNEAHDGQGRIGLRTWLSHSALSQAARQPVAGWLRRDVAPCFARLASYALVDEGLCWRHTHGACVHGRHC